MRHGGSGCQDGDLIVSKIKISFNRINIVHYLCGREGVLWGGRVLRGGEVGCWEWMLGMLGMDAPPDLLTENTSFCEGI